MGHKIILAGLGSLALLFSAFVSNDGQEPSGTVSLSELEKVEKQTVERVAGAAVYKMPLISKINVRDMELFPHYKPKRAAAGWKHAYIEFPTPTEARVWVEEIPPRTFKLIGRPDTGQYVFIGVSGKGYTEFREDVNQKGKGLVWTSGDHFYMPFGSWYGHANPFDEPARILISASHLDDNDLLNPFMGRTRTVPEQTFPGERRDPVPEDTVIENVDWDAVRELAKKGSAAATLDVVRRGPARTPVFRGGLGSSLNMTNMEWPIFYKKLRGQDGWKGGHAEPAPELGYRANFTVLQEFPPGSKEIGHKHGGGVWFLILKGRGYMALRATVDSPEARIDWGEWDLWCMPWLTAGGTWHSHANPYDQPARFITVGSVIWDNDGLLNGRIDRVHHISGDGVDAVTGGAPDKVFREKTEAPPQR